MYKIYQVGYGDTIDVIATKVNSTVDELNKINGFDGTKIMMGDLIIVPNKKNNDDIFVKYQIKNGDTLYMIAKNYGINSNTLALLNGLNKDDYIYTNQEIIIPRENVKVYITKEGDTIDTVLNNFNTTIEELKKQNNNIYLEEDQLMVYKDNNM